VRCGLLDMVVDRMELDGTESSETLLCWYYTGYRVRKDLVSRSPGKLKYTEGQLAVNAAVQTALYGSTKEDQHAVSLVPMWADMSTPI
jgi:hypothetical protein